MKKRRVEVMIETHQTWIIREPNLPAREWCPECARTVRMVTADEAARIVCQSTRAIYAGVEAHRLHYRETPDRRMLICFDSLLADRAADTRKVSELLAPIERESDCGQET